MLRRAVEKSIRVYSVQLRQLSANAAVKEKWDLHAGVLVERHPILTKPLNEIETKFQAMQSQIEFENSLKSDFELRHEKDLILAEKIKKGQMEVDLDDTSAKQTAQDLKDAYVEELKKFQLAPRTTEADKKKDKQATNRDLEDILFLLVDQKLGDKSHMILPQGQWQTGETLRQTAERVLKEKCGENIEVMFYGNAPCGFFKYKYPAAQRKDSVGVKIFFFRSALKSGNVDKKIAKKFEWLDKNELGGKLKKEYAESVQQFLI